MLSFTAAETAYSRPESSVTAQWFDIMPVELGFDMLVIRKPLVPYGCIGQSPGQIS